LVYRQKVKYADPLKAEFEPAGQIITASIQITHRLTQNLTRIKAE